MKILHISSEPPGDKSGGQLVVKESIYSLSRLADVDFLGPKINNNGALNLINKKYYIECNNTIWSRVKSILTLNLSSYYYSFKNKVKKIDIKQYNYIYIEFSKWLFAVKYVKKYNKKVIIRLHNIEKDYSYNLFRLNKTLKKYLAYLYYSYIESNIIEISDYIIVLTEKDKKKIKELYKDKVKEEQIIVMPVCVKKRSNEQHMIDKDNINLLVTGSLWYGPNYEGIKWFVVNVWNDIREYCNLYVVGSKPNKDLIEIISKDKKIILVENPEDTKEYFEFADIYISPIFNGAGMKVKNAEAMSYGLPIIGTTHSFIGYESSKSLHYISNNAEDFIESINTHKNRRDEEIINLRNDIDNDFNVKYNLDKCYIYLAKVLLNKEV